jgi:uncharacterized protein YodC (DUF2158 family)
VAEVAKRNRARIISRPLLQLGEGAMAFKVGDVVQLKSGGARMTVSKLFKSSEGCEMVQCTWFDKKPREHRAAFVIDSLESRKRHHCAQVRRTRLTDLQQGPCEWFGLPANAFSHDHLSMGIGVSEGMR